MIGRALVMAGVLLVGLVPSLARADCKSKLAEVDGRLASSSIDATQRNAMQQARDQAADLCAKGAEPTAIQLLGMLEMMLSPGQGPGAPSGVAGVAGEPQKPRLDEAFLAGTWCSMTGEERVQLVFSGKGTYKPCFPAANQGYVQCAPDRSSEEWKESYVANQSQDPDELLMVMKRGGQRIFRRGECSRHGR